MDAAMGAPTKNKKQFSKIAIGSGLKLFCEIVVNRFGKLQVFCLRSVCLRASKAPRAQQSMPIPENRKRSPRPKKVAPVKYRNSRFNRKNTKIAEASPVPRQTRLLFLTKPPAL